MYFLFITIIGQNYTLVTFFRMPPYSIGYTGPNYLESSSDHYTRSKRNAVFLFDLSRTSTHPVYIDSKFTSIKRLFRLFWPNLNRPPPIQNINLKKCRTKKVKIHKRSKYRKVLRIEPKPKMDFTENFRYLASFYFAYVFFNEL